MRRAGLAALVFAAAWGILLVAPDSEPGSPRTPIVITADEYDRIELGMTYDECVAIIGATGTPFGASNEPGREADIPDWISYAWRNTPDSYAHVAFDHGRVDRKQAFNLP